jgi:hypothetical protein
MAQRPRGRSRLSLPVSAFRTLRQINQEKYRRDPIRSQRWRKENPSRFKLSQQRRGLRKYGLTVEDFRRLSSEQGGHCLICTRITQLVVDHDHASGVVRGLVCGSCNCGMGFLQDNPTLLEIAAAYLRERTPKKKTA